MKLHVGALFFAAHLAVASAASASAAEHPKGEEAEDDCAGNACLMRDIVAVDDDRERMKNAQDVKECCEKKNGTCYEKSAAFTTTCLT